MWDYPFYTLCHNVKNHQNIRALYSNVKIELDNILDNPITTNMVTDGYLKPVSNTSTDHASLIKQKLKNSLNMSVSKLPQVGFANYGDFKPDIFGQADFLDHYFTAICPEWAFEHISDGRSTHTQINTLKTHYPFLYTNYVNNSMVNLIKSPDETSSSDRLALYSYLGLETHPSVSYAQTVKNIQAKMEAQKYQSFKESSGNLKRSSSVDVKRFDKYARPFTSSEGRLP